MPLISCPECSRQVSDAAPACPACGVPIAAASDARAAGVPLTTIQETSKRLKLHILGSVALIVISITWLLGSVNTDDPNEAAGGVSILLLLIGLIWFIVTRFRIWWHHK